MRLRSYQTFRACFIALAMGALILPALSIAQVKAAATPAPSDAELAAHATTLSDADFVALKMRMQHPITEPCQAATGDHQQITVPPETCTCMRDAYYKQVNKADFEQFIKTHQVRLDDSMQAAQKQCLLNLPEATKNAQLKSDDRYNMLQTLQARCLSATQAKHQRVDVTVRNQCSCLATQRLATMSDADVVAYKDGKALSDETPDQKKQWLAACKK